MQLSQMQQMLRQESLHLKNQITDLKNAFDLNRDILKILSSHTKKNDPQNQLLYQIISRLTTINNQAMINGAELLQQKNQFRQDNLKLRINVKELEEKLEKQYQQNEKISKVNGIYLSIQQKNNLINNQLSAANQQRIILEQQIEYLKQRIQTLQKQFKEEETNYTNSNKVEFCLNKEKIKRKYTSDQLFRQQSVNQQLRKQNKRLLGHVQELQNRLIIFLKAFKLDNCEKQQVCLKDPYFEQEKQEIKLLKYALNDINIQRQDNELVFTLTQRYKQKDNKFIKYQRKNSWPKIKNPELYKQEFQKKQSKKQNKIQECQQL